VWLARAIPPRRRLEIAAAVSLAFLVAGAASARQGYTPRACGLDMNRNGIVGEPADCHVCDGTTTDPDFDGIDEDINYVDSVGGVDLATCGSAQAPCASLPWVLAGSNTLYPKRADGGLSDPEDILCVKGVHTLSSTLALRLSGTVGSYAADLHPQDAATWGPDHDESFRYASDPFLLVGWDADGDGSYPPFDADDRAEIVANPSNKLFRALAVTGDQIEIAHLTWSDFGEGDTTGASATGLVDVGPATDLLYLHDLVLRDVNRASRHNSGRILVSLFNADGSSYFAFVNNSVERMAGYGFRGSCAGCTDFRIDHNTATVEAVNSGSTTEPGVTWFRAWDTMDRVSVSFNHVDANPDLWLPGAGDNTLGIAASICVRDFVARGNRLIDFREAFRIRLTTTTGECGARPVDNVTIDRNVLSQAYAPFTNDRFLWAEQGSGDPDMYLQNLVFSNNVMSNTVPMQDALLIWGGSNETDFAGTYHVVNNTVHGSFAGDAFEFDDVAAHNADVVLRNNLVAGSMTRNVDYLYADSVLVSDHNVWESTADFRHRGASATSFSAWQALGFDGAGDDCAATFVAPPFDLHLAAGDTCAGDQGSSLPEQTTVDLDGEARPGGCAWDVGADERPGSCGGETAQADIAVVPGPVDFDQAVIGNVAHQAAAVENRGTEDLYISTVTDPTSIDFALTQDACSDQTLAPGAVCAIEVSFSPLVATFYFSELMIDSDDPDTPTFLVGLVGEGVEGCTAGDQMSVYEVTLSGAEIFEACVQLAVGSDVALTATADIVFRAGATVRIQGPFSVASGARLRVEIDPLLAQ
jgi:hypothetical protein